MSIHSRQHKIELLLFLSIWIGRFLVAVIASAAIADEPCPSNTMIQSKTQLSPLPSIFPKIDRHPAAQEWVKTVNPGKHLVKVAPKYDPKSTALWQVDLRSMDASQVDFSASSNDLIHADFDSRTKWPAADRMPLNFDWQRIMELGKSPGLHIHDLHAKGITGKGIGIAVIDQPLLVDHQEYQGQLRLYEEVDRTDSVLASGGISRQHAILPASSMHGPAVASIAVGKTVGVAPEADLYFFAMNFAGVDGSCVAKCIRRILNLNHELPADRKIRVISMSFGFDAKATKGYDDVMAAIQAAKDAELLVISSSVKEVHGFRFHGLGRSELADPDSFESYGPGLFWAQRFFDGKSSVSNGDHLLVPMDSRTTASPGGPNEYVFYSDGGWSWSIPYIAGMYALAAQVDSGITPDLFWSLAMKTGRTIMLKNGDKTVSFGKILDPCALISALQNKASKTSRSKAEIDGS